MCALQCPHKGTRRLFLTATNANSQGARCPEGFAAAAARFARQLVKYEGAEGPMMPVGQGREPPEFWECLGPAAGGQAGDTAASPRENSSYDRDFEVGPAAVRAVQAVAPASLAHAWQMEWWEGWGGGAIL
jgi:hypothetical protein